MQIVSLYDWQDAAAFCREYVEHWWEESKRRAWQIVARCLHPSDRLPLILVAKEQDKLRGIVMLSTDNSDVSERYGPWIMLLQVPEPFRNRGIGTTLVAKACNRLESLGYTEAYIDTMTARRFFEKLGWTFVEKAIWRGEQIVIMRLKLSEAGSAPGRGV